jgi:hypothetical protein
LLLDDVEVRAGDTSVEEGLEVLNKLEMVAAGVDRIWVLYSQGVEVFEVSAGETKFPVGDEV